MNHYAQQAKSKPLPICPNCGKQARKTKTRYGLRAMCCDLWSWDRHPLVDAKTHKARNKAHAAFDELWRGKKLSRSAAYAALAEEMNLTADQCHMKLMDYETAIRVPIATAAIRDRVDA
jgi:ssDNA-binding Zn-finger/Zn-ribbon topoisomerase 1